MLQRGPRHTLRNRGALILLGLGALAAVGLSGCGAAGKTTSDKFAPGGTLRVSMGTAPDSLDPDFGYTTQSYEAMWLVYTPLLASVPKSGTAGNGLIPGLAKTMPVISDHGKTYSLTLRKGLVFSNGTPVKASDVAYSMERALKLGWGGDAFYTEHIVGALAYEKGRAKSISGVRTNDATGTITIKLIAPYGAFAYILSLPPTSAVPPTTPMTVESSRPPAGVGPYKTTEVQPGRTYVLSKNARFASLHIPDIPDGYVNRVVVTVQANNVTEAQDVLNNTADEFDWFDTVPPALQRQIQTHAKQRYRAETLDETDYFFLNTRTKPFNNTLAREAVNLAVNRVALQRLAAGTITPTCYLIPPGISGHGTGKCPFGAPSGAGAFSASTLGSPADVSLARKLIKRAGLVGTPVTVWGENGQPYQSFSNYLATQLNTIGLRATLKVVTNSLYGQTVGSARTDPQAGFAAWYDDYPSPGDFYYLLDGRSIQSVNNENYGLINDAHINAAVKRLDEVANSNLPAVAPQWSALEKYTAAHDYVVPFGNQRAPFFLSDRVDFAHAVFNPLYGDDWATFELRK